MKFEKRVRVFAAVAVIFILVSVILGVISLATIDKNEKRIAELEALVNAEEEPFTFYSNCTVSKDGKTCYPIDPNSKRGLMTSNTWSIVTIQGTKVTARHASSELITITFDINDPHYKLSLG